MKEREYEGKLEIIYVIIYESVTIERFAREKTKVIDKMNFVLDPFRGKFALKASQPSGKERMA